MVFISLKKGKSRWRRCPSISSLVIKYVYCVCMHFSLSKFKFNCHCFVTKMCQLLSQVSLSWHLIKCVNCACLNWQLKNSNSHVWQQNRCYKCVKRLNRQLSLNAKCITNIVLLRTCQFGKIGNLQFIIMVSYTFEVCAQIF